MPRRSPDKPPANEDAGAPPFIQLDYLYVPSADVSKDLKYFTGVLGGEVGFADAPGGVQLAAEVEHDLLVRRHGDRLSDF